MKVLDVTAVAKLLKSERPSSDDVLSILKTLCLLVSRAHADYDPKTQELLLRVLDRRNLFQEYHEVRNSLIRQVGLYPYLDTVNISERDALALEMHRPENLYEANHGGSAPERKRSAATFFTRSKPKFLGEFSMAKALS